MLMRRASKFCVEPRSPFYEISHQESQTIGKPPIIVSWPECQPEFPSDGGGDGGGVPTTLDIRRSPGPTCPGTKYPVRGIPHFDKTEREGVEGGLEGGGKEISRVVGIELGKEKGNEVGRQWERR